MAAPTPSTGHSMVCNLNTGTHASPSWSEVDEIEDLSIDDLSLNTAELKRRNNNYTKVLAGTFNPFSFTFNYKYGLDATVFDLIRADFFGRTVNEYAIMGDTIEANSEGLRAFILLTEMPWDQALENASAFDFKGMLAYAAEGGSEVDPDWYIPTA